MTGKRPIQSVAPCSPEARNPVLPRRETSRMMPASPLCHSNGLSGTGSPPLRTTHVQQERRSPTGSGTRTTAGEQDRPPVQRESRRGGRVRPPGLGSSRRIEPQQSAPTAEAPPSPDEPRRGARAGSSRCAAPSQGVTRHQPHAGPGWVGGVGAACRRPDDGAARVAAPARCEGRQTHSDASLQHEREGGLGRMSSPACHASRGGGVVPMYRASSSSSAGLPVSQWEERRSLPGLRRPSAHQAAPAIGPHSWSLLQQSCSAGPGLWAPRGRPRGCTVRSEVTGQAREVSCSLQRVPSGSATRCLERPRPTRLVE